MDGSSVTFQSSISGPGEFGPSDGSTMHETTKTHKKEVQLKCQSPEMIVRDSHKEMRWKFRTA